MAAHSLCIRSLYPTTSLFRFLQHSTIHWLEVLDGCGFPYGPINSMQQVFSDPQVHAVSELKVYTKWPFVFKLIVPSTDLASSQGLIKKWTVGRPAWEQDY